MRFLGDVPAGSEVSTTTTRRRSPPVRGQLLLAIQLPHNSKDYQLKDGRQCAVEDGRSGRWTAPGTVSMPPVTRCRAHTNSTTTTSTEVRSWLERDDHTLRDDRLPYFRELHSIERPCVPLDISCSIRRVIRSVTRIQSADGAPALRQGRLNARESHGADGAELGDRDSGERLPMAEPRSVHEVVGSTAPGRQCTTAANSRAQALDAKVTPVGLYS
jgi:hypothetical protein